MEVNCKENGYQSSIDLFERDPSTGETRPLRAAFSKSLRGRKISDGIAIGAAAEAAVRESKRPPWPLMFFTLTRTRISGFSSPNFARRSFNNFPVMLFSSGLIKGGTHIVITLDVERKVSAGWVDKTADRFSAAGTLDDGTGVPLPAENKLPESNEAQAARTSVKIENKDSNLIFDIIPG
jgi:hypothetical protein